MNILRRVNWLWKHRHKHDGEDFNQQIQIIRTTIEEQAGDVSAGGSGAYIHLFSSGQTVTSTPAPVEWTGLNGTLGLLEFAAPTFPVTEVPVLKPGYYDAGMMVGFEEAVTGASVTVVRVRTGEVTVFPPGLETGIWAVDYPTKVFSDVAKGIEFEADDQLKVYVSAGSSVGLEFATLHFELVDRSRLINTPAPGPSGYRELILSHGPIAYWRLGESAGTQAVDETGNGHHGTYVNTPTLGVTGLIVDPDTAVTFDRTTEEHITVPDHNDFDVSSITLEAWISTSATPADEMQIMSRDNGGGFEQRVFQWRIDETTGFVRFLVLANNEDTSLGVLIGTTDVRDGLTHHLVLTYDGTTAILYLDGVVDASDTLSAAMNASAAPVRLAIRSGKELGDNPYTGILDEVAIWGRVLTPAEVTEHYNVGTGV